MLASISDRDKKILLILLIAAVIFLPYTWIIKEKNASTEDLNSSNEQLEERLAYLENLDKNRDLYLEETEKFKKDSKKIVEKYPSDIKPENYAMFLLDTEYKSDDAEDGGAFVFNSIAFGNNVESAIGDEEVSTEYTSIVNQSSVTYISYYSSLKYVLKHIMEYSDPMTFSGFTASFDEETGEITGELIIKQYAISGGDQPELPKVNIHPDIKYGNEDKFGMIFGDRTATVLDEEDAEAAEETAEETSEDKE